MQKQQDTDFTQCPIEASIALFQGKWKVAILLKLVDKPVRFNELSRQLPKVTQRMLTNQLRELENDGLVHRKMYQQVPPKVEYSLTDLAKTLTPILSSLRNWGKTYISLY